jgi:hypothetical protein
VSPKDGPLSISQSTSKQRLVFVVHVIAGNDFGQDNPPRVN